MEISHARGKAFGIPVNGTLVSVDSADVGTITQSASGLTRNLLSLGKTGVVAATTLGLCYLGLKAISRSDSQTNESEYSKTIFSQGKTLVSSLANATTEKRDFTGICMNEKISFVSEGHEFTIPFDYVSTIDYSHFHGFFGLLSSKSYDIELFDGGVYETERISIEPRDFVFFTILGKQKIKFEDFIDGDCTVFSSTIKEKKLFVKQLTNHLNRESDNLVKLLGKNVFERYFYQE